MNFFENTRKPQGFGGKLMAKMMNSGHAKVSQWGFSNISAEPDAKVLDVGCGGGANIAIWLDKCRKDIGETKFAWKRFWMIRSLD